MSINGASRYPTFNSSRNSPKSDTESVYCFVFGESYHRRFSGSLYVKWHNVHLPFLLGEGGVEPPTKFSKSGGLIEPQLWEGDSWKRGGNFFQMRLQIYKKTQLKSEIFNDKKSL